MDGNCVRWAVSKCVYIVPESKQSSKQVRASGGGSGWHTTVELEISCPKSSIKYDANDNSDSRTGATSTVKLPLPDEITLDSSHKEFCKIRFWRDSYSTVLSSSTSWHCTIVKLSNAQKFVLEEMWILPCLNYMTSLYMNALVGVIIRSVSTVRIQYMVSLLCGWWLYGVRSQQVCLRCVRIFINTSQCHNASRIKWWGHVVTDGPRHLLYTKLTQPWCQGQLSPWHWHWIHYETMRTMIGRAIDYSLKKYWHASSDYSRPQLWICKYS